MAGGVFVTGAHRAASRASRHADPRPAGKPEACPAKPRGTNHGHHVGTKIEHHGIRATRCFSFHNSSCRLQVSVAVETCTRIQFMCRCQETVARKLLGCQGTNKTPTKMATVLFATFSLAAQADDFSTCADTANGATGYYTDGYTLFKQVDCAMHTVNPPPYLYQCGTTDDDDFTASVMCCICGGGIFMPNGVPMPPPTQPPPAPPPPLGRCLRATTLRRAWCCWCRCWSWRRGSRW